MIAPHRVLGEALTGRLQEFRRHLEVALGRSDIEVTEVGSELWKQSLDVLAGAIPSDDTMHGRGVAKIMQARRPRFADGTVDTGSSSHVLEHRDDARIAPSSNAARREERRRFPERHGQQAAAFEVRGQFVGKLRSDRNQTRLEEFCTADGDDPFGEVDVLQGQAQCLADTHAGSVEEQQQRAPLPTTLPKLPPQQTPYIYSTDELRRLLEATAILRTGRSRQVPAMYCTLLLLLYGTGMRIGEALRLTLQDVDLAERIITVRCTKFFKTRLVPIGPKLADELAAHLERRGLLPMPLGKAAPLFASRGIRGWSYPRVIAMFQHVRRAAGIACPVGEPRPPRLHDLRHTAAVHRVVAWYRTGQDVQRLLPQLATYLGHLNIRSTQRYLRMTPELLQAASQRFAQYAMGGDHEG